MFCGVNLLTCVSSGTSSWTASRQLSFHPLPIVPLSPINQCDVIAWTPLSHSSGLEISQWKCFHWGQLNYWFPQLAFWPLNTCFWVPSLFYLSCIVFPRGSMCGRFLQLFLTVYIWLIYSQLSRLNLASLSASCVETSMISPDVSPTCNSSSLLEEFFWKHSWIFARFHRGKCPTFFFFSTLQSSRLSQRAHCLLKRYLSTACSKLRVNLWTGLYLNVFAVCRSLSDMVQSSSSSWFSLSCSSNPPAISLSLLGSLVQKNLFRLFGHKCERIWQCDRQIAGVVFNASSHCDGVCLSQLVTC